MTLGHLNDNDKFQLRNVQIAINKASISIGFTQIY